MPEARLQRTREAYQDDEHAFALGETVKVTFHHSYDHCERRKMDGGPSAKQFAFHPDAFSMLWGPTGEPTYPKDVMK